MAVSKYVSSPYDSDKHPDLLIKIFEEGGDVCNFASRLNLSERTFFNWVKVHPELHDAYEIAKAKAKVYLTAVGLANMESKEFQFNVWSLLMRNRCKTTEHRSVEIDFTKCKTPDAKLKILEKAIACGEFTPIEAKYIADIIKVSAEVHEKTEIARQVDELMKLAGKG